MKIFHKIVKSGFRKYLFSALCAFLITGIASAQISHTVNFSQSGLVISAEVARDGIAYKKASMQRLFLTEEIGKPELPIQHVRLIIPSNQDVAGITVTQALESEITGTHLILPVQYPVPTKDGELPPFVKPDPAVYSSDDVYPSEIVKVVRDGYFDGANHIVTVAVHPVQYRPKSGRLIFHSRVSFELKLTSSSKRLIQARQRSAPAQEVYNNILRTIVDNPGSVSAYQTVPALKTAASLKKTTAVPFYEYVVITTNALKPYFASFVSWKKERDWILVL